MKDETCTWYHNKTMAWGIAIESHQSDISKNELNGKSVKFTKTIKKH